MPEYLHPGVYLEEIESGGRPIEGVATSTSALLGEAERGPITPRLVTSFRDYQRWFGGVFDPNKFVPYAASGFFENGGTRAVICRLVGENATVASAKCGPLIVRAAGPGLWGTRVKVKVSDATNKRVDGTSAGFRLQLAYWSNTPVPDFDPFLDRTALPQPSSTEEFDNLDTDETSPDYYAKRLPLVDLETGDVTLCVENSALGVLVRPVGVAGNARPTNGMYVLTNGADDPAGIGPDDYAGLKHGGRTIEQGLAALESDRYREVALAYAPDASPDTARKVIAHCEKMRFRFAVIDSPKGVKTASQLNPLDTITESSDAAFYYPWLVTADPLTGARTLTPPGGHVLGVYARTDAERGVFKAPANETVRGALSLEFDINNEVQESLNSKGVNVIRDLPGRGIRVWGARTISADTRWRFVSVRRLLTFLEHSIAEGTRWVVFEPNDQRLWARVTDTVRLFLRSQWRQGALFGRTEDEAFFIKCDRTTMTQDDILNGRLICEIGVAPVKPAEFVNFRIFQWTAEARR